MESENRPAFVGRHYQVIYEGDRVRCTQTDRIGVVRNIREAGYCRAIESDWMESARQDILVEWDGPFEGRLRASSSRVQACDLELVEPAPAKFDPVPDEAPKYKIGLLAGQPILPGHPVISESSGQRGVVSVTRITHDGKSRVEVRWRDGGWSDTHACLIGYDPTPATLTTDGLELPRTVHDRLMSGMETDADWHRLADAYRQAHTVVMVEPDPMFATNGVGR